ncbi:Transcription initiation factor IIB [Orchesella cincta]|uniref:Transcription initiation factor IIB n=1 Tax=Orchesella cincta TaxID=48709 RepID=A0A1D2M3Y2_ORCCI|nr:Transcription initiation factor IIB [Orchesella cincta]
MSRVDSSQAQCSNHPEAPLVEDYKAGDQICSECGLVVGDRVIDIGSEWRTLSNEATGADRCRVGGAENLLLNGSDLTTIIGGGRGTAAFDELGNAKYTSRKTVSSGDRALMNAFDEISQIADRLHLPKTIVDRANSLFKTIHDGKKLRGRSTDAIASACLCIASRQEGVAQTFKEVYYYNGDLMSRFCSHLGLSNTVRNAATAVAKTAEDLGIVTGRSPLSVAAAAIYIVSQASQFKRSQKEIGDVAGVGEETVRQVYRLMYSRAEELFPTDFVFFTPIDKLPVS